MNPKIEIFVTELHLMNREGIQIPDKPTAYEIEEVFGDYEFTTDNSNRRVSLLDFIYSQNGEGDVRWIQFPLGPGSLIQGVRVGPYIGGQIHEVQRLLMEFDEFRGGNP